MTEKTACLIGQRDFGNQQVLEVLLYFKIKSVIQKVIDEGYTHFITAMDCRFDLLAVQALIEIKKTHPKIKIECAITYENMIKKRNDEDKQEYERFINKCDTLTALTKKHTPESEFECCRYMIDKSSLSIVGYNDSENNKKEQMVVNYAKSKGVEIIKIKSRLTSIYISDVL